MPRKTKMDPIIAAKLAALADLPVFDRRTAPIEDYTCSLSIPHGGRDVPVVFVDELTAGDGLPQHRKVRCTQGHVTNGIPVQRFRGGGAVS